MCHNAGETSIVFFFFPSPSDQQIPSSPGPDDPDIPGIINIQSLEKRAPVQKYHADLLKPPELRSDASEKAPRKIKKKTSTLEPQMMVS